ncbi:MAG TPA: CARDB domain-containing protein, partial [Acidimicrobiales bacterium]|nr:CARDB domain-containing protein [Acidimicrobiales bacterium]
MARWLAGCVMVLAALGVPVTQGDAAPNRYDLTVTSVAWNPASPAPGDRIVFSAIVQNVGRLPTPAGISWRLAFAVDGVTTNWVSTPAAIPAGATLTLTASSGPNAVNYWTARGGPHTVTATADDQNRLTRELSEANNWLFASLTIGSPTAPDCSGTSTLKVGPTRGGLTGFANGYRYGQLTATERTTYMDAVAATGAKWFRMNMESWDINEFRDVLAKARARGLCVIGNLNANPSGAHWADPPDHQAWADQVASTYVAALKGDVNVWEVWNEPNLTGFWPSTSDSYADLLHRTYLAIHATDPDAVVLGAGLSPVGGAADSGNAVNFWTRVYDWNRGQGWQGSAELFDGLGYYLYLFPEDLLAPVNAAAD